LILRWESATAWICFSLHKSFLLASQGHDWFSAAQIFSLILCLPQQRALLLSHVHCRFLDLELLCDFDWGLVLNSGGIANKPFLVLSL
jgi:hypothetical protein